MPFDVGDQFEFEGHRYTVPPARPGVNFPLEIEGAKGIVTRVQRADNGSFWALKEFRAKFRNAQQHQATQRLTAISHLPGLQAARQSMILPTAPIVQQHPDLCYAALMPWMQGLTWGELLSQVQQGVRTYTRPQAINIARALLQTLQMLEQEQIVHCDLSPGNVIVQFLPNGKIQIWLIDLEEMYIRGQMPANTTPGTPGYHLPDVKSTACPEGDRYAGAILVAEALLLGCPAAREHASSEGAFRGDRQNQEAQKRFDYLQSQLRGWLPGIAALLERAWNAPTLAQCASFTEILDNLPQETEQPGLWQRFQRSLEKLTRSLSASAESFAQNLQQLFQNTGVADLFRRFQNRAVSSASLREVVAPVMPSTGQPTPLPPATEPPQQAEGPQQQPRDRFAEAVVVERPDNATPNPSIHKPRDRFNATAGSAGSPPVGQTPPASQPPTTSARR
jgi:serine/threonine protein kinase